MDDKEYWATYEGIERPRYTQVPDEMLNGLLPRLGHAEFKVAMCIARKTFGWGKDSDAISLSQLQKGTGMCLTAIKQAVKSLEEKGVLQVGRSRTGAGGAAVNTYSLVIKGGRALNDPPQGGKRPNKKQSLQETNDNENESLSFILEISERHGKNGKDRKALVTSLSKWPLEVVREAVANLKKRLADGEEVRNPGAYLNSLLPIFGELQEEKQAEQSKAQRERLVTIASAAAFHRQAGDDEQTIEQRLREDFPGEEELLEKVLGREQGIID